MTVAKILKVLKPCECTQCHRKDLRWISYTDQSGKDRFGMVPAADPTDVSEVDHPLTIGGCNARQLKAQKGETTVGETINEVEVLREVPATVAIDHGEVDTKLADHEARITHLDAYTGAIETRVSALAPALDAIGDYLTTEVATMRTEIQRFSQSRPIEIRLVDPQGKVKTIDVGRQHVNFANLVAMVQAVGRVGGIPFLVGEAGSWKSSAMEFLGRALNLRYLPYVCGEDMSATDVFGYTDATGKSVDPWGFRDYYENGGIVFLDEIGNASASGLTSFNSLTSNRLATFAGGQQVIKHADNVYIAADNTYGRGQDALYISRQQLDAATLSRFVYLPWQTDLSLLGESLGLDPISDGYAHYAPPSKPRSITDPEVRGWGQRVKSVYDAVQTGGIRAVVSSRAVINGRELLLAGLDPKLVEFSVLWGHMSSQDGDKVRNILRGDEDESN